MVVHGSGPGAALASSPAGPDTPESPDVMLLAPARSERADGEWLDAAGRAAASVPVDGVVVAARPPRELRARLAEAGLAPVTRLLHVPDVAQSRHVLPLMGPAAPFALRSLIPLSPAKRVLARAVALPGAARFAPTSTVFRRPGARPLFAWLCAVPPSDDPCTAIVSSSWQPGGAAVLHRFGRGGRPDAVAKVGGGAAQEGRALDALGAAAGAAGVDIPALLGSDTRGGVPVIVETALAGASAPALLRGAPRRAAELSRRLAGWLEAWNAATADPGPVEPDDVERVLLAPARRLASELESAEAYLPWLEGIGAACAGRTLAFVAAHNDLTAANVLVDGDRLGIVDWEHAAPGCLPLTDLAYALVDLAAAVDSYRDRPSAYAACFEPGGEHVERTTELVRAAAAANGVEDPARELCLHACWLHHADNERRKLAAGGERESDGGRPFLAILRRAAAAAVGP